MRFCASLGQALGALKCLPVIWPKSAADGMPGQGQRETPVLAGFAAGASHSVSRNHLQYPESALYNADFGYIQDSLEGVP
jgi:hypothetical protein